MASGLLLTMRASGSPQEKPAGVAAEALLVPDSVDVTVAFEKRNEILLKTVDVRVDNGKDFAQVSARVAYPKNQRWVSIRRPSEPVTVVSPSTLTLEISIDPGKVGEAFAVATIEITGARPKPLALPVSVRIASPTPPPAPSPAPPPQLTPAATAPIATAPSSGGGAAPSTAPTTVPAPSGQKAPSAGYVAGNVAPRLLDFIFEPGKPPPEAQKLEIRPPVDPDRTSPIVTFKVTLSSREWTRPEPSPQAKSAQAVNPVPSPKDSKSPSDADNKPALRVDWLVVSPREGDYRAAESDRPVIRVSARPGNLKAGIYRAFVIFTGLAPEPISVPVTLAVGSTGEPPS